MWRRGRYEASLFSGSNARSWSWREDFARRSLPEITGGTSPNSRQVKFWHWLAMWNGCNESGLRHKSRLDRELCNTVLDAIIRDQIICKLPFWVDAVHKRPHDSLLYWSDTGLLNFFLGFDEATLLNWETSPKGEKFKQDMERCRGKSWEGFVINSLLRAIGDRARGSVWIEHGEGGGEIDLILDWIDSPTTSAIEITLGSGKRLKAPFRRGYQQTGATRAIVVYCEVVGREKFRRQSIVSPPVEAMTLQEALRAVCES